MTISYLQSRIKPYNDMYPDRPVWALVSHPAAAASPMVAMYGERSPFVPLGVEAPATVRSRAGRVFSDEAHNSAHYFMGSASVPGVTSGQNMAAGMHGITGFSQTGCLLNFEISDNGNYGWYSANLSGAEALAVRSGVVVGESNWRQCYDLVLAENLRLFKAEIGGGDFYVRGANRPFVDFAAILATAGTSVGGASGNWGMGQVAHNRNSGRLMVVQPRGGTSGVNLVFRLHFFDLRNKIGRDTKISEIQTWVTACMADAARYRFVDVTFATTRAHWAADNTFDSANSRFVLCDNDEVWMFKSADTANTAAGRGNALFRVNLTGGTWRTGNYAATESIGFVNTVQYGLGTTGNTGTMFAARHLNSDDNSIVALFQHNYYYNVGMNLAMVSTRNAAANSFTYATHTANTGQFAIAPSGGNEFVLCQTQLNQDGRGPFLTFMSNDVLNGGEQQQIWTQSNIWPSVASSTMYGANIVTKVQPTTEWK